MTYTTNNDYMGDCAECLPYSSPDTCNNNKLEECVSGDMAADAHWVLLEECENGCIAGSNTCN